MKKIFFLLVVLIMVLTVMGSVVVSYASSAHPVAIVPPTPTVQPTPTAQPTQQPIVDNVATVAPELKGSVIGAGSSTIPEVALTFDDGPSSLYTPQVLSILQSNSVHATFFCVGEEVQYYSSFVQQEYAAGNVVGNHSWNHPDLTTLASSDVQSQLSKTSAILQQATGVQPTLFRPPYGAVNANVKSQAAQMGLTPILWSIDTLDWTRPGADAIVNAVLSQVGNGDIILMHDGGGDRSQTVAALPRIISGLQQRGLKMVTVSQLLNDATTATATPQP